uniref:DUF6534 domain-containing protein n=1 Tax=Psilocybe cubensis TaxID=181762 RepID=A0A8H8CQW2_PSICU
MIIAHFTIPELVLTEKESAALYFISALSDVVIAGLLCYFLKVSNSRTKIPATRLVLKDVFHYVIATGILTSACEIGAVIAYFIRPNGLYFAAIHFSLGRLYTNSLLAALNARKKMKDRLQPRGPNIVRGVNSHGSTITQPNMHTVSIKAAEGDDFDGKPPQYALPGDCDKSGETVLLKVPTTNLIEKSEHREVGVQDTSTSPNIMIKGNQLPFEILAHIFQLYVDEDNKASYDIRPMGAFPLGAVCRMWRHVAWACPKLWASLQTFHVRQATTHGQIQLAVEWLSRSGQYPLTIFLRGYILSDSSDNMRAQMKVGALLIPLMDAISHSLNRLHTLGLIGLPGSTVSRLSWASVPATALKRLYLDTPQSTCLLDLSSSAPSFLNMQTMSLDALTINWNNLTEYGAAEMVLDDVLQVLALAPRIAVCHIVDLEKSDDFPLQSTGRPVVCHELTNLYVNPMYHTEDVVSELLQKITCPKLDGCTIDDDATLQPSTVLDFLHRSCCPITGLVLGEEICSGEDLYRIATAFPSLTTIWMRKLDDWMGVESSLSLLPFFNALCVEFRYDSQTHPVLLPQLKIFTVDTRNPIPWGKLPGFRHKRLFTSDGECNGYEVVRPGLEKITMYTEYGYFQPQMDSERRTGEGEAENSKQPPLGLIRDWQSFSELVKLAAEVRLDLQVKGRDLFYLSYVALKSVVGEAPDDVKQFMEGRPVPMDINDSGAVGL